MKSTGFIAALIMAAGLQAQDQYTIKSSVKMEGLPEAYSAFAESDKVVMIKGDKVKKETTSMMSSSIEYSDGKTVTTLQEYMGNKTGWTATMEEMEAAEDSKKDEPKIVVEKTSDKRTIAGYECQKSIVKITAKDKDKKDVKMDITIWHTDKIKKPQAVAAKSSKPRRSTMNSGSFDFKEIDGFPMHIEFTTKQQGMDLKYVETVSEVSTDKIDDSEFVPNTEGYKMMSYKEMMEQMKKMSVE